MIGDETVRDETVRDETDGGRNDHKSFALLCFGFVLFYFILFSTQHMKWTEPHDIYFLREMMLCQPWQHKKGSLERGETWA